MKSHIFITQLSYPIYLKNEMFEFTLKKHINEITDPHPGPLTCRIGMSAK